MAVALGALCLTPAQARAVVPSDTTATGRPAFESGVRTAIEQHLGRPYVWGAAGLKSFDCSGFVWRVMQDNGILIKRTTARKYYMSPPRVAPENQWAFGNIVFFANLKHCGIVDTRESFYHSSVTAGTHLSRFTPLWRSRVTGVRGMPGLAVTPTPAATQPLAGEAARSGDP